MQSSQWRNNMSAVIKVEVTVKTPEKQKPKPTSESSHKPSQDSLLLG